MTEERRKRVAVAAVLLDRQGRLLCVKPTYRSDWLVPGGMVELDEAPLVACRREVAEEIGLEIEIGRLLCAEYRSADASTTEALYLAFWGGELSDEQVARIVLPPGELSGHCFLPVPEALKILAPRLALRIDASLRAQASGATFYLENGELHSGAGSIGR